MFKSDSISFFVKEKFKGSFGMSYFKKNFLFLKEIIQKINNKHTYRYRYKVVSLLQFIKYDSLW